MKSNRCCGNCVICSTEALVGIEILNYSEVDADLIAMAQLGQPDVEVLQPTAGQLADLNDDGVGDISSDPSSDPPFDGRVARFIQLNLSPILDNCLEGDDIVDITAEVTYTRTAQTPPTISDDGSIGFANRITDTFLGTPTLIMGGADVVGATASVTFGFTKAELLTGGIVVLLGLQTQDGTLPVVNGIDWTDVSVVVSASATVMCDAEAMRTVGCNDNAMLDLLEQIADGSDTSETKYCYAAVAPGTGYSKNDILQYTLLNGGAYIEWFNQNTGFVVYSESGGVPSGTVPNLLDLRPCTYRTEVITPACYQWDNGGVTETVTAYAGVDVEGGFNEWVVTSGTPPPNLTSPSALTPCGSGSVVRQRQATLSAGETWPSVTHFVTGSMQSLTVIVEAGTASSQDLISTLSTTYPVGSYQWGVTGAGETLQFSAFQFDAGSNGKIIWTERD